MLNAGASKAGFVIDDAYFMQAKSQINIQLTHRAPDLQAIELHQPSVDGAPQGDYRRSGEKRSNGFSSLNP